MADSGRPKAAIPAWQRTQPPTESGVSDQAGKDGIEAGRASSEEARGHADEQPKPIERTQTDGSVVAAEQEFEASKSSPSELRESEEAPTHTSQTDGTSTAAKQEFDASRQVLDQVHKFLNDPQVRDAPVEQKVLFLESKGVPNEIITDVLSLDTTSSIFSAAEFQQSRQGSLPRPQPPRELPPVVTYPEFLMQPQKPLPLVTINRLLNTAYIAGGLAATIYGLSKFVVSPLSASLNEARHELAEHATSHLTTVNDKLSGLVSTLPTSAKLKSGSTDTDDFDDMESTVSDPTELFHRDIGTQTSPLPSPGENPSNTAPPAAETTLSKQEKRLKVLHSHMAELLGGSESNGTTNDDVQTGVAEFRHYLDSMVYSPPAYQYHPGDTVWTPPGTPKIDKKDDVAAAFKAEIRGVKGVLLSAKRFPSAAAVR